MAPMKLNGQLIFGMADVAAIADLPRTTLKDWIDKGIVRASVRDEKTKGKERLFNFTDLFSTWLAVNLRKNGIMQADALKRATAQIYVHDPEVVKRPIMFIAGQTGDVKMLSYSEAKKKAGPGVRGYFIDVSHEHKSLQSIVARRTTEA